MSKFDKMASNLQKMHTEHSRVLLRGAAAKKPEKLLRELDVSSDGLDKKRVESQRGLFGRNIITHGKKKTLFERIVQAFVNPFTAILFVLGAVSFVTDVVMAEPGDKDPMTVIIISTMVMISGALRFVQETRSGNAAEKLTAMIKTTTNVTREGAQKEILLEDVVVGDIVISCRG